MAKGLGCVGFSAEVSALGAGVGASALGLAASGVGGSEGTADDGSDSLSGAGFAKADLLMVFGFAGFVGITGLRVMYCVLLA